MPSRYLQARIKAMLGLNKVNNKETVLVNNGLGKIVYCYLDGKLVAEYDSITKCANALGMSRAMVKKAIDNSVALDNGFLLTFNK